MNPIHNRYLRSLAALGLAFGLSACASVDSVDSNKYLDTASRAAPVATELGATTGQPASSTALPTFKVVAVNVSVPETLRVSEANRYYPGGDIVWREDPIGNRHEQVRAIVAAGISQGTAEFQGAREVTLDIVVTRFHALTEKARYTVGGVHAIQFDLVLRDAATGALLNEPRRIKADFDALGGQAAIAAEARGVTQKRRITNHLAFVIQQELGRPGGYAERDTGLIGALNQL